MGDTGLVNYRRYSIVVRGNSPMLIEYVLDNFVIRLIFGSGLRPFGIDRRFVGPNHSRELLAVLYCRPEPSLGLCALLTHGGNTSLRSEAERPQAETSISLKIFSTSGPQAADGCIWPGSTEKAKQIHDRLSIYLRKVAQPCGNRDLNLSRQYIGKRKPQGLKHSRMRSPDRESADVPRQRRSL
jgi:hypothetical protein